MTHALLLKMEKSRMNPYERMVAKKWGELPADHRKLVATSSVNSCCKC